MMPTKELIKLDHYSNAEVKQSSRTYRRIFFQHIQKTGGTSVVAMLQNFVPRLEAYGYREDSNHARRHMRGPDRATLFFDHQPVLHRKTPDAFAFAFFREPFARLISARRQVTDATDADIAVMKPLDKEPFLAMRHLTMEQILDIVFDYPITVPWFWNHQALMLGLWPLLRPLDGWNFRLNVFDQYFADKASYRAWFERNRSNILKSGLKVLRSLDYVGLNEDFEVSVNEVFARLGLPEPEVALHLNARAAYNDEKNTGLREKAAPFINLDQEIYEEAKELHARSGRTARGAPFDFIRRSMTADEDRRFGPEESPGGHGWHQAALREDHFFCRWTGPTTKSDFTLHMDAGTYRIEMWFFGAASTKAIETVGVAISGEHAPVEVEMSSDAHYLVVSSFVRKREDRVVIRILAGETVDGLGLELEEIRIVGARAPTYQIHAHEWRARRRGRDEYDPIWEVGSDEDVTFLVDRLPEGYGWRHVSVRPDGSASRWSGRYCSIRASIKPGAYVALVRICGAVCPDMLPGLRLSIDGNPTDTTIIEADNGRVEACATIVSESDAVKIIRIDVPKTIDGYGVEIESFRFVKSTSPKLAEMTKSIRRAE